MLVFKSELNEISEVLLLNIVRQLQKSSPFDCKYNDFCNGPLILFLNLAQEDRGRVCNIQMIFDNRLDKNKLLQEHYS